MNAHAPDDTSDYQVIVVGGGINGLAVARAAAQAGFKVALIERGNFGQATSANSLRIIHGGFRYLQSLDIPRVIRSLRDQTRVSREFPELVRPLPCYLPLKRFGLKSHWPLKAASLLYRFIGFISGISTPEASVLSKAQAEQALPLLAGRVPFGAFRWHDLQLIDPEMLHQALAGQIASLGGDLFESTAVAQLERSKAGFSVRIIQAGEQRELSAAVVVNTTGPWVESLAPDGLASAFNGIGWCRGFNLVFEGNQRGTFGAGLPGEQGRLYFVVGRDNETAVGTEYLRCTTGADQARVSEDEIGDFLSRVDKAAPGMNFSRSALKRVELGVLPLESSSAHPEHGLIGSARIKNERGYIAVLSTKYTTFLSQADQVKDLITNCLRISKE